jgi:hypothetical protein
MVLGDKIKELLEPFRADENEFDPFAEDEDDAPPEPGEEGDDRVIAADA